MEIHAPDKPIHSKKEFLFHMLTVVLGILIALGLDGIVTWGHHRALVREARENIRIELRHNRETIEKTIPGIQERQQELQAIISAIDVLEATHQLPVHHLGFSWTNSELFSTAWKTASISGAVTYMDYEELKQYTEVYDLQQDFLSLQSQSFVTVAELTPAMRVLDQEASKQSFSRLEEVQRIALKGLTIQRAMENVAAELTAYYGKTAKER